MDSRVRDIVEKIGGGTSTGDKILDFLIVTNHLFDTDNDLYRTLTEFRRDIEANDGNLVLTSSKYSYDLIRYITDPGHPIPQGTSEKLEMGRLEGDLGLDLKRKSIVLPTQKYVSYDTGGHSSEWHLEKEPILIGVNNLSKQSEGRYTSSFGRFLDEGVLLQLSLRNGGLEGKTILIGDDLVKNYFTESFHIMDTLYAKGVKTLLGPKQPELFEYPSFD